MEESMEEAVHDEKENYDGDVEEKQLKSEDKKKIHVKNNGKRRTTLWGKNRSENREGSEERRCRIR